jgi:hypothetical protein
MKIRVFFAIVMVVLAGIVHTAPASAASPQCFPETGFCIDGRIKEFWEQNGGLSVFGYPIGAEEQAKVEGGTYTVQRFERNRLELHPENPRPYDVLIGRLGAARLRQLKRDWFTFAKNGDTGGCQVMPETGFAVCGAFLNAFHEHGLNLDTTKTYSEAESLALFGLPISDAQTETLSDGKQYLVQWFERARFEYHPENQAPYDVLFGLLGSEVETFRTTVVPTNTPAPTFIKLPTATISPYLPPETLDTFRSQMPLGGVWVAGVTGMSVTVMDFSYAGAGYGTKYVTFRTLGMNLTGGSDAVNGVSVIDLEGNYGTFAGYAGCYRDCQKGETWTFLIPANTAPAQIIASIGGSRVVVELRVWPR